MFFDGDSLSEREVAPHVLRVEVVEDEDDGLLDMFVKIMLVESK